MVREALSVTVQPVFELINRPIAASRSLTQHWQSYQRLLSENQTLKQQWRLQQGQLLQLSAIKAENQRLRDLLHASQHDVTLMKAASVIKVAGGFFRDEFIINQGAQAGTKVGQAVIDTHGLLGQVVRVNPYTSDVLLLSDSRSAVPVQDNRSGVRAVLVGNPQTLHGLELLHVTSTADVREGDLWVTSGLGGRFPKGYPVGDVVSVERNTGAAFANVLMKPRAHLSSAEEVLLLELSS